MTPLIPEPVILRVVRLIERVKDGLETSDGWFLWNVLRGHIGTLLHAELGRDLVATVDRAFPAI